MTQDQAPQGELYFTPITSSEREALGIMMGYSADLVENWICEHKGASDDHWSHTSMGYFQPMTECSRDLGKAHPVEPRIS